MKIGIVSDSHGRIDTLRRALELLRAQNVDLLLHCGDIDDSATVREFTGWQTHFVFGNCDWDRDALGATMQEIDATLHQSFGHLEINGKQIAWTHGDNSGLLHELEHGNHYDYLFYGHTHVAESHVIGKTRVVNPGALHRARQHTCAVLDLDRGDVSSFVVR